MKNKVISILFVIVAWLTAGTGLYYVFVKGFEFFHIVLLLIGLIAIVFAERKLKRTF